MTTQETNKQRLRVTNIITNKYLLIGPQIPPLRLIQARNMVVDPAKMADMPEPIAIIYRIAEHVLTGVAVDRFGSGSGHQSFEFLDGSSVIDRDVLETPPDVPVWKEYDLGLPGLVDFGDRLEQWLVAKRDSFVT